MILWTGWGILAFFAIGIAVGIMALLGVATGTGLDDVTWQAVVAFLIVGAGVFFLGKHLNVTRPTRQFEEARGKHFGLVTTSTTDASGAPAVVPLDQQPALHADEAKVLKKMRNRHTLFFVPMQWWGVMLPLLGIGVTLASMN